MQLQIWSGNKISSNVLTISRIWAFALASFSSSISLTSSSVIPLKSSTSSSAPILTVWKYTYNHHAIVIQHSDIIHAGDGLYMYLSSLQSDELTSNCSLVGSGDLSGTSSPSGSSYGSSSTIVWYILPKWKHAENISNQK